MRNIALTAAVLLCASTPASAQIPAFPGAEGAGAFSPGGRPNAVRGGLVYHVTTLNPDPGGVVPGSLRYGMKNDNFISKADDWPFPFYNIDVAESFEITPRIIVF